MSELRLEATTCFLGAIGYILAANAAPAACRSVASSPATTAATLERSTQALVDAIAPVERSVWEHYTDPAFVYVTEDNEVKNRAQALDDLKPLPAGSSGWIVVQEFHCTDFGSFAVTTYIMDEHETLEVTSCISLPR